MKKLWGGKLILKGILDPEDAKLAAQARAPTRSWCRTTAAASSTARSRRSGRCRRLFEAVNGKTEVWLDGGIRSGQDVLRALALGARAMMIGRAYAYGLGALGERASTRALEIIEKELDVTMALCGLRDVKDASPAILRSA